MKKTTGAIESISRRHAIVAVFTTVVAALVVSLATLRLSPVGLTRWQDHGVFHLLIPARGPRAVPLPPRARI
ncbi:hypothetical protein [Paraburkholderia sacchari]|uniref:hypothetical protein n=1 Tax=Paraburkholderia sacchari TaxID=159450 RepID=UPI001F2287F3|nr:hypothetical protein [Paraburkholderia sacchari]